MTPVSVLFIILGIALCFLAGALPFSVWLGQMALRRDIRGVGDGNPGATNVLRAGGWRWGLAAFLLDYLKAAAPVGFLHFGLGWSGWLLVWAALAPVLGHAFSPLLRWRGGKAVAATFGAWTGLTVWEGPTFFGLLLGFFFLCIQSSGWAVMLAATGALIYFIFAPASFDVLHLRPDLWPVLLGFGLGNLLVLGWKHRTELTWPPAFRWRGGRWAKP